VELSPPLWPTVPAHVLPPKVGQHETSQKRVKKSGSSHSNNTNTNTNGNCKGSNNNTKSR